jgi:hypothetical protein
MARLFLGPFEEKLEEIGISSDVVKVEGEDPAAPGCLSLGGQVGTG